VKERNVYRIGEVAELLGVSVDTLRYHEKIGLLPGVMRSSAGRRIYAERDLARLRFIRRAQAMDFTLAEIAVLLELRDAPARSRPAVRELARAKLAAIDARLETLSKLRGELAGLVAACTAAADACPILAGIERRRIG